MESIIIALDLRQVLSDAGATQTVDGVHGSRSEFESCGSTKWSSAELNQTRTKIQTRSESSVPIEVNPCERVAEAQR